VTAQWATVTIAGQFERGDPLPARLTRLLLTQRAVERGITQPAVLSYPDRIVVTQSGAAVDVLIGAVQEILDRFGRTDCQVSGSEGVVAPST
jgi:hypothetical protein